MNREIKFRAWTKGKMFYESFEAYLAGYGCLFQQFDGYPDALMQFTGLLDKNQKPIYEGDIVMYENDYPGDYAEPSPPEPHNDFAIVEWSEEARWNLNANFKDNRSHTSDWIYEYGDGLEIIGNIYESPELMNRQSLL